MRCPFCHEKNSAVVDSRASQEGCSIRRRRECPVCGKRFTTFERVELNLPTIVKRTGIKREYDREKVRASMRLALRKRPVINERLEEVLNEIEQQLQSIGEREVSTSKVGELVLGELRKLDMVAYIRFASVYYNVDNPEGFRKLMAELELAHSNTEGNHR